MLEEILNIESQIQAMKRNPLYLKIKHNLSSLEEKRFRSQYVSVPSMDDPRRSIEIRSNSLEMKELVSKYRNKQREFDMFIDGLINRKNELTNQLFRNALSS